MKILPAQISWKGFFLWKIWKSGGSRENYVLAKKVAKQTVFAAKKKAEKEKLNHIDSDSNIIYRIAKQMKQENKDIVGEKCIRDDDGVLAFNVEDKKKAWKQHYERPLNVEFPWREEDLSNADPVLGPPLLITKEMVEKSISKMKIGKASGPSGVVTEMLKASSDVCSELIADLTDSMIHDNIMPSEWDDSFIISLFKGKGEALDRGNYRGLKLTEHVLKVVECIIEVIIRDIVNIDEMQFGFMPGCGTTDAIFILRQIQEKYINKNCNLYFAFIDLEKAFDRVPRKVLWWALRKVGVPEWIVRVVQIMYQSARCKVKVNNSYSDVFNVQVGVHQGSVLSPLLFIIVLEALSHEFRTGCPWELLYADDLVIIADTIDKLLSKLGSWKTNLEAKGLRVNMGKTKIMVCGKDLHSLKDSGKHPCGVCCKGVGCNSILCEGCQSWIHKKCSGIKNKLKANPMFRCKRCLGLCRPIDGRSEKQVTLADKQLEVVESLARCGKLYNIVVRGTLLHASECWPLRREEMQKLLRNERAILCWMLKVKIEDNVSLSTMCAKLNLAPLQSKLRLNRLRWYGLVVRSENWINSCFHLEVDGFKGREQP